MAEGNKPYKTGADYKAKGTKTKAKYGDKAKSSAMNKADSQGTGGYTGKGFKTKAKGIPEG